MHTQYNQKLSEIFGQQDPFTLGKDTTGNINNPYDMRSQALEPYFEDIFCGKFWPNISTLSVSTRSNISYQNFDLSSDIFINGCLQEEQNSYFKSGVNEACNLLLQISEQKSKVLAKEKQNILIAQPQKNLKDQVQMNESSHDQTKNIPKNYIKAIFSFILDNNSYLERLFNTLNHNKNCDNQVLKFVEYVKAQKKIKKYTIERLKALWLDEKHGKAMRIISNEFLRKRCLGYISGSKIFKKIHHIRYRHKFTRAVESPHQFTNIK